MSETLRPRRAGEPIQDLCRACHAERDHTIIAVDQQGRPLRVVCGFCGSQHNYRGGGEDGPPERSPRGSGSAPRLGGSPFPSWPNRKGPGRP